MLKKVINSDWFDDSTNYQKKVESPISDRLSTFYPFIQRNNAIDFYKNDDRSTLSKTFILL